MKPCFLPTFANTQSLNTDLSRTIPWPLRRTEERLERVPLQINEIFTCREHMTHSRYVRVVSLLQNPQLQLQGVPVRIAIELLCNTREKTKIQLQRYSNRINGAEQD